MPEINKAAVLQATKSRAIIETTLAKDLYDIFNRDPIIGELRTIVRVAMANMVPFVNDKPSNEKFKNQLVRNDEHKNLAVLGKFGCQPPPYHNSAKARENLEKVLENYKAWDASDCSDIIRLFGDLCEHAKGTLEKDEKGNVTAHGEINKEEFASFKPDKYFFAIDPAKTKPAQIQAKKEYLEKHPISRTRASGEVAKQMTRHDKAPDHIVAGRSAIKTCKLGGPKEEWGISRYRLMPKSTVRKIDIAFGLPEGADASGTTADSILVMNRVKSFEKAYEALGLNLFKKVPEYLLQLLPLVTMVAKGHHTLFESALTLTYHKYINYAVGFYDSLLPEPEQLQGVDVSEIEKALKKANVNKNNTHILAYYDQSQNTYKGYQFTKEDEIEAFRAFATMRYKEVDVTTWLNRFRDQVSPLVTWLDLLKIGAPVPKPPSHDKNEVSSYEYKYKDMKGDRVFKQLSRTDFVDREGNRYRKCSSGDLGAFAISIKGFRYGWLSPVES